jgi:hypothetical protein
MPRDNIIEAERRLLAALCQGSLSQAAREKVLQHLARHHFQLPENEIILRAIIESPAIPPGDMREALQAKVTRLGFPDTDIDVLFRIEAPTETDLAALFAKLEPHRFKSS